MIAIAFAAHVLFLGVMTFVGGFSVRPDSPPEAYTVEVVSDGELGGHMPSGLPKLDLGGQEAPKHQMAKQAPPPPRPQPAEPKPPEPVPPPEPEKPPEPPPPPPEPAKPAAPEPPPEAPKAVLPAVDKPPEEGDLVVATATPTAKPTARPTPKPSASPRPSATPPPRPAATEAAVKPSPRPSPGRSPGAAPKPTLSPPVVVRAQPTPSAQRASGVAEAPRSPQPAPTSASEARIAAALERVQRQVGEQKKTGGTAAGTAADGGVRAPGADARGTGGVGGTDAPDPNKRIGIGPGRGGAGELRGVEFLLYYNKMLARIRETWVYTGTATNVEVKVRFRVQDDGVVSDLRVTQPSGDPSYDASVVRAVRAASPLGPPPEKHRADFADVELTFQPGDLKKAP